NLHAGFEPVEEHSEKSAGNVFDERHIDADRNVLLDLDQARERFAKQSHVGPVPDFGGTEFEHREAVVGNETKWLFRHGLPLALLNWVVARTCRQDLSGQFSAK